jgi:CheY-like chemotaxis protein
VFHPNRPSERSWPVILLIENEQDDVFLFRRAISKLGRDCHVRVVSSATEAKSYLENTGAFKDANYYSRPDLIVSDFKLANHTALEFVQWLRRDPRFLAMPLVMLSGVTSQMNMAAFEGLNVSIFLRKTGDVHALSQSLEPILPKDSGGEVGAISAA